MSANMHCNALTQPTCRLTHLQLQPRCTLRPRHHHMKAIARASLIQALGNQVATSAFMMQIPTPAAPTTAATQNIVSRLQNESDLLYTRACSHARWLLIQFILTGSEHLAKQSTAVFKGTALSPADSGHSDSSSPIRVLPSRQRYRRTIRISQNMPDPARDCITLSQQQLCTRSRPSQAVYRNFR